MVEGIGAAFAPVEGIVDRVRGAFGRIADAVTGFLRPVRSTEGELETWRGKGVAAGEAVAGAVERLVAPFDRVREAIGATTGFIRSLDWSSVVPPFEWPTIETLSLSAFVEWLGDWRLPEFEWPDIPELRLAERFEALTGWSLPPFAWPDIETLRLADRFEGLTGWSLPPFEWPDMDDAARAVTDIVAVIERAAAVIRNIVEFAAGLGRGLRDGLAPLRDDFAPTIELLGTALGKLGEMFGSLFGSLSGSGREGTALVEDWGLAGESVGQRIADAIKLILAPVQLVQDAIVGLLDLFDRLAAFDLASAMTTMGERAGQALKDTMGAAIDWVRLQFDKLLVGLDALLDPARGVAGKVGVVLPTLAGEEARRRVAVSEMVPETEAQRAAVAALGAGGLASGRLALDGARAGGGIVERGGRYLVGERGPEIFAPSGPGLVLPAALTAALMGDAPLVAVDDRPALPASAARAQGGGPVTIAPGAIVIHAAPGQDEQALAAAVLREVERRMSRGRRRTDGDLHDGGEHVL